MMAQKHLHELLKEDQEPFLLNEYISDKRSQIKRPSLQVMKKHKPLHHHQNSNFPVNLCKNVCIFSFQDTTTPDLRKSPLFEFASPIAKSPTKSPNAIFLHIPSRTATLLLEAALKIHKHKHKHKHSSSISTSKTKTKTKTKTQNTSNGFGLLGSLFKRLTQRNQNRKREIEGKVSVKDILRWDYSSVGRRKLSNGCIKEQEKLDFSTNNNNNMGNNENVCEVGFICSYNGRSSSAVWSESNEDKSLDMETSSSCSSHCDEDDDSEAQQIGFGTNQKHNIECACCCCHDINGFCDSPFRFVLQSISSPSSCRHTPELTSPAPSPSHHGTEDKVSNGAESHNKFQSVEEEEEDKEQCSPVSVLDPPFEDDDEGPGNDEEEDSSDLKCSYAIVQRAKQQLLYNLRRFEKLAGLHPVELEKRMLDQDEDGDEYEAFMEEDDYEDGDSEASYKENDLRELVFEALCHSSVHERRQIPEDLKKLVSDLIVEEDRELDSLKDRDMVIRRVCKRLELWKEVESNTIDMMIEEDFSREDVGWKKNVEQIRDMAGELELSIFGFLVEEFSEELVC